MKCCVIGGTGFIGQHLVQQLVDDGKEVIVIARNRIPSTALPAGVSYFAGDYSDKIFLQKTLKDVDEIVDLSYPSIPEASFEDPIKDILDILPAHINLFEVASSMPIKKLIVVSSGGTIYGKAITLPISEDHPTEPISPYGITKLVIEKYANMYYILRNLPVVCIRPSNAYGEGQKPFAGQGLIATVIASALEGKEIILFGKPGVIRDFIHVTDVANGIVKALEYGQPGHCYNLGTGVGTNTYEILEMLRSLGKPKDIMFNVNYLESRKFDVPSNVLNSLKLRTDTHWIPKISLMKGLELTWSHLEKLYNERNLTFK